MQLHQQYQDQGLEIITLNMEGAEALELAEDVLQQHNITLTNFSLVGGDSEENLKLVESEDGSLPAINLHDRNGKLRVQMVGIIDDEELANHTDKLLGE